MPVGYSSPTQSEITEDLGLSVAEFSLFGSLLTIGAMLGAVISGKIIDFLGRKGTMWILNLFYIGGWLAIAFTKVSWLLDLGRFVLGFRNGIAGFLMPVYVAEVAPKNLRGTISALGTLMVCWGLSFMYVVGSFVNWRTLALIATIPGLLQLPLLFFIPESPRWLAKVGRQKDLEVALQSLRGDKVDISEEATEIKDYTESLQSASEGSILDVFQKKYIRPLLIFAGLLILQSLGGIAAIAYYSGAIFLSAGISSMVGLVTLAIVQTLLGALGISLVDKVGRRPVLLVCSAGLCLGSFLTGLSFLLQDFNCWDQGAPYFALIGLLLYMASYTLVAGMTWLLVSEVFPVNVKGSAGSICNFVSNVFNWIVAYFFNFLIQWSSAGIFFIFSAFCGASFLLGAAMVPETKGRTLEEIQASMFSHSME
ncbi:sugar transporter ERD6-like 5 isoform X2 [Durio zibethinus]|uniref:Sugar transporter ERD6-like 5 isoform X2 n=1 Tax=Durio zibethinus TaxID=66656 RepID=A0A6P5WUI8_DURZI|nr:sugar transporter ERD6-like 5 isoform X2 [Durio zibethinus]